MIDMSKKNWNETYEDALIKSIRFISMIGWMEDQIKDAAISALDSLDFM